MPSKTQLLERLGTAQLLRLAHHRDAARAQNAVHLLDDDERRALARIERAAALRAALAGALSALAAAVAESMVQDRETVVIGELNPCRSDGTGRDPCRLCRERADRVAAA